MNYCILHFDVDLLWCGSLLSFPKLHWYLSESLTPPSVDPDAAAPKFSQRILTHSVRWFTSLFWQFSLNLADASFYKNLDCVSHSAARSSFLPLFFGFHSPLCLMIHVFHPLNSTLWVIFCLQSPPILSGSSFIPLERLSSAPVIICTVTFSCHVSFLSFSGLFFFFFFFLANIHLTRSAVSSTDTDRELIGPDAHIVHVSRVPRVLGAIYW